MKWIISVLTFQPPSITVIRLILISHPTEHRRLSWPRWLRYQGGIPGDHHTQPFYGSMDFVWDNPGETVPETFTHYTHHSHQSPLICFLHLLRSMTSSLFNLRAWQSFSTISLQVFFALPLGLVPSTSYFIHFFTQSLSSFCSTCPYHRDLFHCSTEIVI